MTHLVSPRVATAASSQEPIERVLTAGAGIQTSDSGPGGVAVVALYIDHDFTYADTATREGATGLVAGDVGKIAYQNDTGLYWELTDDDPVTWTAHPVSIATGAGAIATHAAIQTGVHGLAITAGKVLTVPLDASISGTNTGDNAANSLYSGLVTNATHTGDVTGSGALTIGANKVTLGMLATLPAGTMIGNDTAGALTPKALTLAEAKAWLGTGAYVLKAGDTMSGTLGIGVAPSSKFAVLPENVNNNQQFLVSGYQPAANLNDVSIGFNAYGQVSAYTRPNTSYNAWAISARTYTVDANATLYFNFVSAAGVNYTPIQILGGTTAANSVVSLQSGGGKVGIGTSGALAKLTVADGQIFIITNDAVSYDPGGSYGPGLRLGFATTGSFGYIVAHDTGVLNKPLAIQPNGGNVGINTTAPPRQFSIKSLANTGAGAGISLLNTSMDEVGAIYLDNSVDAFYITHPLGGGIMYIDSNNDLYLQALNNGNVRIGNGTTTGSLLVGNNCSALSFTDRTPFYSGDAVAEIRAIRGKNGQIDHKTLPAFAKAKHKVKHDFDPNNPKFGNMEVVPAERDLGAMISMLTVAIQQVDLRITALGG